MSDIKSTLLSINAIKECNLEIFSHRVRDRDEIKVYRDKLSGVIFIDDYYVGVDEYTNGLYLNNPTNKTDLFDGKAVEFVGYYRHLEDELDSDRRYSRYKQFIAGKEVCDFGCEAGSFLRLAKQSAKSVVGIELQDSFVQSLNSAGISCYKSLDMTHNKFDLITMFHCMEHLPNPIEIMSDVKRKLKGGALEK